MEQQISYCAAGDGVRIAYATYGNERAHPLLFTLAWLSQERIWSRAEGKAFLTALAQIRRLVTFDYRGMGASQRDAVPVDPVAQNTADAVAVMDHLQIETFDLFSIGASGLSLAATAPERVTRLVLFGPGPRKIPYSQKTLQMVRDQWGLYTRASASVIYPDAPAEALRWISDNTRLSAGPEYIAANGSVGFDYTPLCARVRCPVLVLHRERDQNHRISEGRELTALIPGARFVGLPGGSHHPMWGQADYMASLEEFLGVAPRIHEQAPVPPDTNTLAILFLDIAESTALTEQLGDTAFRSAARAVDESARLAIRAAGGTPVEGKVLGDGVLGVFTSTAAAIEAARQCAVLSSELALPLHIGLHAGDVLREGGNVYGGAVNIAARICALCEPGEILVSATVRDLARTSAGVTFEDRGEHTLKGVGEPLRVFAVRLDGDSPKP